MQYKCYMRGCIAPYFEVGIRLGALAEAIVFNIRKCRNFLFYITTRGNGIITEDIFLLDQNPV